MSIGVVTGIGVHMEATVAASIGAANGVRLVRRCPDVADLLAVAGAHRAEVAVIATDLPGLDRSVVGDLRSAGLGIVGVHAPGDEEHQRVLQQWGITSRVPSDASSAVLEAAVQAAARVVTTDTESVTSGRHREAAAPDDHGSERMPHAGAADLDRELADLSAGGAAAYAAGDPFHPHGDRDGDVPEPDGAGDRRGQVVVVWGPPGSPGRTVVAVNLAAEAARLGVPTLLIDADTHAASIAQHLALLDEAPGIAAATRLADSGHLDVPGLAAVAPEVAPALRVLTGLPLADRWPEVREDALEAVLEHSRSVAALVVVDVAASLEDDEDLSYDTAAPRRNAATLTALGAADTVLAVGAADPVGLQRLVRGLTELRAVVGGSPRVVVNKVRAASVGNSPERKVTEALARFAGVDDVTLVSDDRAACDGALLAGRTLAEHAANSPARQQIQALASVLAEVPVPTSRRRLART
ncbi:AAA family ATPase [Rudaeicoccus suwonensis]|uniref:MinD-like ATPase involved in chromosome partitioning or flagellar assembly n=1 Tax=Rudaeicoccus suwonensis TaxID=657409 RepID=A0A561E967_9MICO|nr:hypothetical protein [Rudaeicoccus suwonensis]TWE12165.1 MinD-like ATPase involved in chromosome partitioning or flagellar assembly [Rudaeicoccus suwonensis]